MENKYAEARSDHGFEYLTDELVRTATAPAGIGSIPDLEAILSKMTLINRSVVRSVLDGEKVKVGAFCLEKMWMLSVVLMENAMRLEREKCEAQWRRAVPKIEEKFAECQELNQRVVARWEKAERLYVENMQKLAAKIQSLKKEQACAHTVTVR